MKPKTTLMAHFLTLMFLSCLNVNAEVKTVILTYGKNKSIIVIKEGEVAEILFYKQVYYYRKKDHPDPNNMFTEYLNLRLVIKKDGESAECFYRWPLIIAGPAELIFEKSKIEEQRQENTILSVEITPNEKH